jgi:RHS repeat-associated protein
VYDIAGNLMREILPSRFDENNSLVSASYTYNYDPLGRLTRVSFTETQNDTYQVLEEYIYEILNNGHTRKITKKYISKDTYETMEEVFDFEGKVERKTHFDGTVEEIGYKKNGQVESISTVNGTTYFTVDALGRTKEKWIPFDIVGTTTHYTYVAYEYDKVGRVLEEKMGKQAVIKGILPTSFVVTQYAYYTDGRLKEVIDPIGTVKSFVYDGDGNIAIEKVSNNINTESKTVRYEYDYLGNVSRMSQYVDAYDFVDNTTVIITDFTYDKNGNLKTKRIDNNLTTSYEYDELNRRISTAMQDKDEYGNSVEIKDVKTYDAFGNIVTEMDANGNITSYIYNERNQLEKIKNKVTQEGKIKDKITALGYDLAGRKIFEVSPENYIAGKEFNELNRTEYVYDSMGRLLEKKYRGKMGENHNANIILVKYTYDAKGNVIKEQDALGVQGNYGTEYTYNLQGALKTTLDPEAKQRGVSFTTKNIYDGLGRVIEIQEARGDSQYTQSYVSITSYEYDDLGNVLKVKVRKDANAPVVTVEENTYDYLGRLKTRKGGNTHVSYEYNQLDKLSKETHFGDENIATNIITYKYDAKGNTREIQNSLGRLEVFEYDDGGRVLSHSVRENDGTQNITITVRYDKNGNKRFEVDGNGNEIEYRYDGFNRLIKIIKNETGDLDGQISSHTMDYVYDLEANLIRTRTTIKTGTNIAVRENSNQYDEMGRLIEKSDPYNVIEKLKYNDASLQIASYDANNKKTEFQYDKNNRLIKTIEPQMGYVTEKGYDIQGNVAFEKDGSGKVTRFQYDEFDRLVEVENHMGEKTIYRYDMNGNMISQTNEEGQTTIWEYNVRNLPVKRIDPGGRSESTGAYTYDWGKVEGYEYNGDGSLKEKIDREGVTTIYTYDIHGRVITEIVGDITRTYTYDNNSNVLSSIVGEEEILRTYDSLNRVTSKTVRNIGMTKYKYDVIKDGLIAEISVDTENNITTKVYDQAGRLKEVKDGGIHSTNTTVYEYYPDGSTKRVRTPDGRSQEYTFYENNLLNQLINKNPDGTIMDVYTYTYDLSKNQTSKHEIVNGVNKGTTAYTYDGVNRLQTVTEPSGKVTNYTYDKAGNRKTETVFEDGNTTVNAYSYNSQNRLMNVFTTSNGVLTDITEFVYDNNGNQLQTKVNNIVTVTNIYNKKNQLVVTQINDTIVENTYNAEGLRVSKSVNGTLTRYLYEYDKVVLEVDGQGSQIARNLYGTNLLARTIKEGKSDVTLYYSYNGHADVTALVTEQGEIVATYYYDAFGNILEQTGNANNPIRYAGYHYDEETGLYYLKARMYDPITARFLQEDTYRGDMYDPLSLNLYTYVHNNPLMYYDPTGHWPEWSNIWGGTKTVTKKVGSNVVGITVGVGEWAWETSQGIGELGTQVLETAIHPILQGVVTVAHYTGIEKNEARYRRSVGNFKEDMLQKGEMYNNIIPNMVKGTLENAKQTPEFFVNLVDLDKNWRDVADSTKPVVSTVLTVKSLGSLAKSSIVAAKTGMNTFKDLAGNTGYQPVAVGGYANAVGWGNINNAINNFGRSGAGVVLPNVNHISGNNVARGVGKTPWGSWNDYKKVVVKIDGKERTYAQVGNRLYSKHAVDRMQPSGFKHPNGQATTQAGGDYGRSVAPQYVEDVLNSIKPVIQENGNLKFVGGSLEVVTNPQGAVVTIMTK